MIRTFRFCVFSKAGFKKKGRARATFALYMCLSWIGHTSVILFFSGGNPFLLRSWLHGKISDWIEKSPDYMKYFSSGWNWSGLRQEFVSNLCCFGNLHLPMPVNQLFSLGWNFFKLLHEIFQLSSTWVAPAKQKFQPGLKLDLCNPNPVCCKIYCKEYYVLNHEHVLMTSTLHMVHCGL